MARRTKNDAANRENRNNAKCGPAAGARIDGAGQHSGQAFAAQFDGGSMPPPS
jgi:hypothetical protein